MRMLPALLGYRLERSLHEAGFDRFIDDLRAAAPLASTPVAPTAPTEALAASNVVHGLDILARYDRGETEFQAIYSQLEHDDVHRFWDVFTALKDQVDGLGDLLMAEGVFQASRGSVDRTTATLESIVRGETVSVPEFLDTPRSGIGLTHRVVSLIGAAVQVPGLYPSTPQPVRAVLQQLGRPIARQPDARAAARHLCGSRDGCPGQRALPNARGPPDGRHRVRAGRAVHAHRARRARARRAGAAPGVLGEAQSARGHPR